MYSNETCGLLEIEYQSKINSKKGIAAKQIALQILQHADVNNSGELLVNIGDLYWNGCGDLTIDYGKAFAYYLAARDIGYVKANAKILQVKNYTPIAERVLEWSYPILAGISTVLNPSWDGAGITALSLAPLISKYTLGSANKSWATWLVQWGSLGLTLNVVSPRTMLIYLVGAKIADLTAEKLSETILKKVGIEGVEAVALIRVLIKFSAQHTVKLACERVDQSLEHSVVVESITSRFNKVSQQQLDSWKLYNKIVEEFQWKFPELKDLESLSPSEHYFHLVHPSFAYSPQNIHQTLMQLEDVSVLSEPNELWDKLNVLWPVIHRISHGGDKFLSTFVEQAGNVSIDIKLSEFQRELPTLIKYLPGMFGNGDSQESLKTIDDFMIFCRTQNLPARAAEVVNYVREFQRNVSLVLKQLATVSDAVGAELDDLSAEYWQHYRATDTNRANAALLSGQWATRRLSNGIKPDENEAREIQEMCGTKSM